jgi:hypothetical protein
MSTDLIREIEETEKRLKALKKQKEDFETAPVKELAIALHKKMCRYNHTDGCGWEYEVRNNVHDWTGSSHRTWLDQAIRIQQIADKHCVPVEVVTEIIKAL